MTMISDLPNDLEAEILSRVPAKSLSRLKTTCKRWYALFRDPKFVVKNKKLGRAVRESILLTNHGDVCSVAGDLHDTVVNTPIEVSGKLTSLKGSNDFDFAEIFHCDGLMLCSELGNDRLVVWNPCTGQTRNIKARTSFQTNQTYALGYSTSSPSGHSYKILRYFDYRNDQEVWVPQCEIYDLSSDSWRVLDSFPLDYIMFRDGISLKGDTYWVAGHNESGYFMMKFDFTTERFVCLPLPIPIERFEDRFVLSVVRDEKLAVLLIDDSSDYLSYDRSEAMRIWVSNKISEDEDANKDLSWRSDLVLEVDFDNYSKNFRSFLLDEENKVAILCCGIEFVGEYYTTIIYIIGEDMLKEVYTGTITASRSHSPLVITYVPSLVRI
ncbi:unnamed protein product [Brassica rapa]|uniref:F-box domain-containing protein n=1 Tax=Brassica campestris TaxID=3711 RepID=A0A3P5YTD5_BRACM|nr:unnamed protein product [Brassica rapa]VDC71012.1 unnamed protein product [Brassica rapa]